MGTNRNIELIKNTMILAVGQLVPKLLAIIVLPILTAYLTTSEYGTYDLVFSIANLLIPLITLQIQQAVFRYLLATMNDYAKESYVTDSLLYVIMSSVICLPIVFIALYLCHITPILCLIICLLLEGETLYSLLGQIVRGLGKNINYSVSVIIFATVNMILVILLVAVLKLGLVGVLISLCAAYLISDIFMVLTTSMFKYFKPSSFSIKGLKKLLDFSAPIVPSSIALWVVNLSDRLVVIHFLGTAVNGIYSVANKIPTLYNTSYNVFNLAWTEMASRVSDDGDPSEYYSNLFRMLYKFLIGVMLLMIAITPLMFRLLVNQQFDSAFYQVPILYFGVFFNSLVNYYSGIYIAMKRTKKVGYSSFVGAMLNLSINLIFIRKIGLYAASISTAISFMVIVLYRAFDLRKVVNIKYNYREISIGMISFILTAVLMYLRNIPCMFLCYLIAFLYNWMENRKMLIQAIEIVKRKGTKDNY